MRIDIIDRIYKEAYYIINTGATVREAAKVFHYSKSTIHKDVTARLCSIDEELFLKVKKILDVNLQERHLRGGEATRLKYLKERKNKHS